MFTLKDEKTGRKIRPPLFAHRVRIKTEKQKNNKGEFFNFDLEPANKNVKDSLLAADSELFALAKSCRDMVNSGAAKASHETQDRSAGQGGEPGGDGEIPF